MNGATASSNWSSPLAGNCDVPLPATRLPSAVIHCGCQSLSPVMAARFSSLQHLEAASLHLGRIKNLIVSSVTLSTGNIRPISVRSAACRYCCWPPVRMWCSLCHPVPAHQLNTPALFSFVLANFSASPWATTLFPTTIFYILCC